MITLTAPTQAAANRTWAAPIYLLQIDFTVPSSKSLYLADRYFESMGGHEYLPLVADWGTLESALNVLDVNGSPGTASIQLVNTVPIEGESRLSDLIRTAHNTTNAWQWAFAQVTVRQTFEGLTSAGDLVQLGLFFLEDPTEIGELLDVRMSDQSLAIEQALRVTRVNRTEFPTCGRGDIGRSIPRLFGTLKDVEAVPVYDAIADHLDGGLSPSSTSMTLFDASDFPSSAPWPVVQIDQEAIATSGRSGNVLTISGRGQFGTTAAAHMNGAPVYWIRDRYRFAIGEHAGNFKIRSVTNVTIDGVPPVSPVTAQITLEDTAIVSGKAFAMVDLNIYAKFFKPATYTSERDIAVSTLSTTLNSNVGSPTSPMTRTISPSSVGGTTTTERVMHAHVTRSGNNVGPVQWVVERRISGGSNVGVASGGWNSFESSTQNFSNTQIYSSTADEIITFTFWGGDWNDGHLDLVFDYYHVKDTASTLVAGGPTSLGAVRCDVEGLQDDTSGTITGTSTELLENPADVAKFLLQQLYGVAPALFGTTWATTRTLLTTAGYRWAFRLEYETFSGLRRQIGEQARSALYIDAGLWQFKYFVDSPTVDITLDSTRDVWDGEAAIIGRTARTEVINSLTVNAAYSDLTGNYRFHKVLEDLTQITQRQTGELTLAWVQDTATADALATYWATRWKAQWFTLRLTAWWNVLAVTKIDYLTLTAHPALAGHGAEHIIFRITRRDDRLADGRVRVEAIEAGYVP